MQQIRRWCCWVPEGNPPEEGAPRQHLGLRSPPQSARCPPPDLAKALTRSCPFWEDPGRHQSAAPPSTSPTRSQLHPGVPRRAVTPPRRTLWAPPRRPRRPVSTTQVPNAAPPGPHPLLCLEALRAGLPPARLRLPCRRPVGHHPQHHVRQGCGAQHGSEHRTDQGIHGRNLQGGRGDGGGAVRAEGAGAAHCTGGGCRLCRWGGHARQGHG